LTADEKSDALEKVASLETWLSSNSNADKEELDQKASEFTESISLIAQKLGLQGQPGSNSGNADYSGESYDDL